MVKKQRAQVVMNAADIRESYAKLPTENISQLLIALAPHADSNESTREFFDMLGEIVTERAKMTKFEMMAALRAEKKRSAMNSFNTIYLTLTLSEQIEYWQHMITTHARTLNEVEHFQRLQQTCQAALLKVIG